MQHHQAGRLAEAEDLYRRILGVDPSHVDTLHQLGILALQAGRGDLAVEPLAQAADLSPRTAAIHGNLGLALQAAGRMEEAEAAFRRSLTLKADSAETHYNLGGVLLQRGDAERAAAAFRRAIQLRPRLAQAHNNLGSALRTLGRLREAEGAFRQALALEPAYVEAAHNLGAVLQGQGRLDEAAATYEGALAAGWPEAGLHLGHTRLRQGRPDLAEAALRKALEAAPDFAEAHGALGLALQDLGRLDEAAAALERAAALNPRDAAVHNNLGGVLQAQGRMKAAEAAYAEATALEPGLALAHNNLAGARLNQGRAAAAVAAFARAVELDPEDLEASSNLLLCLNYDPTLAGEAALAQHRRWDERHGRPGAASPTPQDPDPERRIRLGYVSGDFRTHPVGYFLEGVLGAHDRAAFEVFCYTTNDFADEATARLRASADHWRSIAAISDEAAADLVASDDIDILVDLSGHTALNRLTLFARRPAPVQASWLGYVATTGLEAMDYLVSDPVTAPPGEEAWVTEALVRLPHGRFCYAPPAYAPAPADAPSLAGKPVVFGSFNNLAKIGPEVIDLWARTVLAAPGARLLLKWGVFADDAVRADVAAAFAAAGLPPDRLELRAASPHADMLAEYGDIDIALDPFPFCGGLTSAEALWMGVPVLTLPGPRPASRQTLSMLSVLGLTEFAAASPDDFVAKAAALAGDPERLAALRRSLRARMAASPLCDAAAFTPTLEAALRVMWRRCCAGLAPEAFDVSPGPSKNAIG